MYKYYLSSVDFSGSWVGLMALGVDDAKQEALNIINIEGVSSGRVFIGLADPEGWIEKCSEYSCGEWVDL